MQQKRPLAIILIAISVFIPAILFWIDMIKEWSYDWESFRWSERIFPWGILITGVCTWLCLGILKLDNLTRMLTIVAFSLVLLVGLLTPAYYQNFSDYLMDHYWLVYPIALIVVLNLHSVKKYFLK